jgi:soluble lytic murein transglycosylase
MMLSRPTSLALLLLTLAVPASGVQLNRLPDQALVSAALELKGHRYQQAAAAATAAPEGGARNLVLGIATLKLNNPEEAARLLGQAAASYPLLADYALFYQARALNAADKRAEALPVLDRLIKNYPDSPLLRAARLLQGDTLFDLGEHAAALPVYQQFVEKYASGNDALQAAYKSARCSEQLGDLSGAGKAYRTIWLNNPASSMAARAEDDLQRLTAAGTIVAAYTPQELFKRGTTLCDLRKFDQALKTFQGIAPVEPKSEFAQRLALKISQTLCRARRYTEAEKALRALLAAEPRREIGREARYWLAKCLDKSGRDEEAFAAYQALSSSDPKADQADDAGLDAAFVRRFQKRPTEAVTVLKELLASHPATPLKERIYWEIGWNAYLAGDHASCRNYLPKLFEAENYRERALYWYGRSLQLTGEGTGAQESFARLAKDFPNGFYNLHLRKELPTGSEPAPALKQPLTDLLPVPDGFERIKALISLGLLDEAGKELAVTKKRNSGKTKTLASLARLYLEAGDYNGALAVFRQEAPSRITQESLTAWGILYPLAFRDAVSKYAASVNLPESLVYAVMRAESAFSPTALSPVGARGLMQLMPATAGLMTGEGKGFDANRLTDPDVNVSLGTRHLRDLLNIYQGDTIAAIAAYNAGVHNVDRWRKTFAGLRPDEFVESIPYGETRDYVKKVLATAALYRTLYRID